MGQRPSDEEQDQHTFIKDQKPEINQELSKIQNLCFIRLVLLN